MISRDVLAQRVWQMGNGWEAPAYRCNDAEEVLAEATVRLDQARLEALLGVRYDAAAFDRLILEYRSARARADAVRDAVRLPGAVHEARATASSVGTVVPVRTFGGGVSAAQPVA